MKSVNVRYEICDVETGEILLTSCKETTLSLNGIQSFPFFYDKFCELCRNRNNVSINILCFDNRIWIGDEENFFIRNKHIKGIF